MKKTFSILLCLFVALSSILLSCGGCKNGEATSSANGHEYGDNGTTMTDGPYKVGDYYNDGTKEGIVFEVYDGGRHGKIVSLDYSNNEQWAVDAVYEIRTGATSNTDGMSNMNKIKKLPNWKVNYPAFAWCAALGSGWYLPAKYELVLIYENRDAINMGLSRRGYEKIGKFDFYWSSTESDKYEYGVGAWYVDMSDGDTYGNDRLNDYYVRAVSAF